MLRTQTDPAQIFERGLLQIAALQCLLTLYCNFRLDASAAGALSNTNWVLLVAHAVAGGLLVLGQRDEPAARLFGASLILVAPTFGSKLLAGVEAAQANDPLLTAAAMLGWFPTDAFGSFFFWRFVSHFPRGTDSRFLQRLLPKVLISTRMEILPDYFD